MHIIVLFKSSLLAQGVEMLLRQEQLDVTSIDLREPQALERLCPLVPGDVVIVDVSEGTIHPALSIEKLLMQNPEATVIGISPCYDRVEIYRKQSIPIAEVKELLHVLQRN